MRALAVVRSSAQAVSRGSAYLGRMYRSAVTAGRWVIVAVWAAAATLVTRHWQPGYGAFAGKLLGSTSQHLRATPNGTGGRLSSFHAERWSSRQARLRKWGARVPRGRCGARRPRPPGYDHPPEFADRGLGTRSKLKGSDPHVGRAGFLQRVSCLRWCTRGSVPSWWTPKTSIVSRK
jgi:hypothetical protein